MPSLPPINYPAQPRNLLSQAVQWLQSSKRIALLTLVNIEGSAPYPLGSQMLVDEHGNYHGQITGGCAESALAQQAVACIQDGNNSTHRYGLNSPYFDIQLPCGSGIDVAIDVLTSQADYEQMQARLTARQCVKQTISTELGTFEKRYQPNERLCVYGQGPILLDLALLALQSGFEVVVISQDETAREALTDQGIQTKVLNQENTQHLADFCDEFTSVVSLFHEHKNEIEILNAALLTPAFYIGALGSKNTHANRCNELMDAGRNESEVARIHGPVGLDIGAQSPPQIAISILAQLIQQMPSGGS